MNLTELNFKTYNTWPLINLINMTNLDSLYEENSQIQQTVKF